MKLRLLTCSPYEVPAHGYLHLDLARTSVPGDPTEALAAFAPRAVVRYFRHRLREDTEQSVFMTFDRFEGEDRFFFFIAPPASSSMDLAVFVSQLQGLRHRVIASGTRTLVMPRLEGEYFGVHPDAVIGMLKEIFADDALELIVTRESTVEEALTGIVPTPLPMADFTSGEERPALSEQDAAVHERVARSGRQARAMLAEGIAHEVRVHGRVIGTVRPNPESWHPGATDRFLLRENSTGMHWHAASVEEAEATLVAVLQAHRGWPAMPRLHALLEWLGGPPQHLQKFVRHLVEAAQRRAPVSGVPTEHTSRAGAVDTDHDRAEAFARTVDLNAAWAVSAELRALEEVYKLKHRSQRKRLLRAPHP